jgi:hypothetical protein
MPRKTTNMRRPTVGKNESSEGIRVQRARTPAKAAPKIKQFGSWSFSRWNEYEECPLRAKLKHLDKVPEGPKNAAADRGQDIALRTERYMAGAVRVMPPELKPLQSDYVRVRKEKSLKIEMMYGFDRQWNPVPWDDWNNCWLRAKMDLHYSYNKGRGLFVIDNKTGKFRTDKNEQYVQQLDLYAVTGAQQFPQVSEVSVQLYYSDLGIKFPEQPKIYTREEAVAQIPIWDKRVKAMFADTKFSPRPGDHCRWCPYSRNKSGHCKF